MLGTAGMKTSQTTNLEKAYEELEKEILDIKNKLTRSIGREAEVNQQY